MVAALSYTTITNVIESWEKIKRIPEWEKEVGVNLFAKFFTLEPEARAVFGFSKNSDMTDYKVLISPRFVAHAKLLIEQIDAAIDMLGPSAEMLSEILLEMGARHARYGVKAEYFPTMGRALVDVVGANLGEDVFTRQVQESWIEVYNTLSHYMIKGHRDVYTLEKTECSLDSDSTQHQVDPQIWA